MLANGQQLEVSVGARGRLTASQAAMAVPPLTGSQPDDWPVLRAQDVTLGNSRRAFDPITGIRADTAGHLVATRPSGNTVIASTGTSSLSSLAALDAGWLRWDRNAGQFSVAASPGYAKFPKNQFVSGGHLLFEPVGAVISQGPSLFSVANEYGVWSYNQSTAALNGAAIAFRPVALSGKLQGEDGKFLAANGDFPLGAKSLQPAQRTSTIRIGSVDIREVLGGRIAAATFARSGRQNRGPNPVRLPVGSATAWRRMGEQSSARPKRRRNPAGRSAWTLRSWTTRRRQRHSHLRARCWDAGGTQEQLPTA